MKNISIKTYDLEEKAVKRTRTKLENTMTRFAYKWLKEHYDVILTHDIDINARLTRSMGRVRIGYHGIHSIEISEKLVLDYRLTQDSTKLIGVLKHELIHYALYKLNLPFKDSDNYFKEQCKLHNAPLSIDGYISKVHAYKCENGHEITRKRKIDTNRYVCGCDSKLKYIGEKVKMV